MVEKETLDSLLDLIPSGKVISYKKLADIFCTSVSNIDEIVSKDSILQSKVSAKWYIWVSNKESVQQGQIWNPIITNYYISLVTKDSYAIEQFEVISHKIELLNPTHIIKTPKQYHITLADLSNVPIDETLINNVFSETIWLSNFIFHCDLHKPYIDKKKNKVIFWIRLENNPFLLTLQQCIKKYVPRRTDKQFIPHITLSKILETNEYNKKVLELSLNTECVFDRICICANVDQEKNVILFQKIF